MVAVHGSGRSNLDRRGYKESEGGLIPTLLGNRIRRGLNLGKSPTGISGNQNPAPRQPRLKGIQLWAYEMSVNPATGLPLNPDHRMDNLLDEIVLADQVDLDVLAAANTNAAST